MTTGFSSLRSDDEQLICSNSHCRHHTEALPYPSSGYKPWDRCPFCQHGRLRKKKLDRPPPPERDQL